MAGPGAVHRHERAGGRGAERGVAGRRPGWCRAWPAASWCRRSPGSSSSCSGGAERGRAFGLLGATIGLSTAVGPLLGGLLIQAFGAREGWRWVFYVNLPIGVVALPLACRLLPAPPRSATGGWPAAAQRPRPGGRGCCWARARWCCCCRSCRSSSGTGPASGCWCRGARCSLAAFTGWERRYARRREPVVDLGCSGQRSYALGVLIVLAVLRRVHGDLLHLHALPAERPALQRAGRRAWRSCRSRWAPGRAAAVGGRVVNRFGRPLVAVGLAMVVVGLVARRSRCMLTRRVRWAGRRRRRCWWPGSAAGW